MSGYQAIVLAAGAGSRFGGEKLVAPWRGQPLVMAAVETARAAPVEEVIVVLGSDAAVLAALSPLANHLHFVVAEDWADGLSASLKAGVRSLPADSRGVLVFLGDMPLIPRDLPRRVIAALEGGAVAAQPVHDGQPAHPVGFSRTLYPDLLTLRGDTGAGSLLRGRGDVVQIDAGDAGAVFDVDYPADLR